VLGFLFTIASLVVFEPTLLRAVLVAFYCTFVGVVVYSMLALNSPFSGSFALSPDPLVRVYEQISAM
jgi:hypothetical protein